jgi:hypothetical protein
MGQLHSEQRGESAQRVLRGEIQDLLNTIARAITAGDGEAVAKLYDVPAFVVGDTMAMAIESAEQVATFYGAGKAEYNKRGITDTRADIVDIEKLGEKMFAVQVRWPYLDDKGKEIGGEKSDYVLRRDDKGKLRIRTVLMRGEEKKHS